MAREGLRTLVVSKKSLTQEQYDDFEVLCLIFSIHLGLFYININFLDILPFKYSRIIKNCEYEF